MERGRALDHDFEISARVGVTFALFWVIVVVFLLQMLVHRAAGPELHRLLFRVSLDWPGAPWTLVTHTLSHAGVEHLVLNALALVVAGSALERRLGARTYLWLFFGAGAAAGLLQIYFSQFVLGASSPAGLGASGAIMALLGALAALDPRGGPWILPNWAIAAIYGAMDLLLAFVSGTGIGHVAHLVGLAIGVAVGWRARRPGGMTGPPPAV